MRCFFRLPVWFRSSCLFGDLLRVSSDGSSWAFNSLGATQAEELSKAFDSVLACCSLSETQVF